MRYNLCYKKKKNSVFNSKRILDKIVEFSIQRCTLQSLTGKYRGLQGNPCNENRFFPMGIGSQGVPSELYRV